MKRILVFVKSEYVRDAQAFTRLDASQYEEVEIYMGTDCEQGWNDIKGRTGQTSTTRENVVAITKANWWRKIKKFRKDHTGRLFLWNNF